MLKVYDKDHNAVGHIIKYKSLKKESTVKDGNRTLSFTYMAKHHQIEPEFYIETQDDEYVVKEKTASSDGFLSYVCALNLEELEGKPWGSFSVTNVTIDEAARLAIAGTGWHIGECTVTKKRNAEMLKVNAKEVIDNLCETFMCERVYDSKRKTISFYERIGEDKGVYFIKGLNLKKLKKKSDSYDFCTRIIPIGADELTIEGVNGGKNYLENYQYSKKVKTYIWQDDSYTNASDLKEDAGLKLNEMSKPVNSYSCEVIDLARQNTRYSILAYKLGDAVTLIDDGTRIREKQRIVKLVEYPQEPEKNRCELANTTYSFEELQKRYKTTANVVSTVVSGDGRYTGTIRVSEILHFEQGLSGSTTISGIRSDVSTVSSGVSRVETGLNSLTGEMTAVKASIGELTANALTAEEADLKYATIQQAEIIEADVHDLQADYGDFKTLTANEFAAYGASIDNLSGQFSSFETSMSQELITAKGWMLEGSIGDAQISQVSAGKIGAGTIDTAVVTIAGTDGRLQISDNTIQIKDADRVRVQVGKDASGDYSMSVWDASGKLIWDALGATENTIQRKIIRDRMVADDAAIQALKIDFQSFDTALTDQGIKISGTVVQVGDKTLNVALTEQTQLVTEHGETLTDHAAKIAANESAIKLRVSTQEFETYKVAVDSDLESAKSRLATTESSITAMRGQIALKVEQTDIDSAVENIQIGGRNLIKNTDTGGTQEWTMNRKDGKYTVTTEKIKGVNCTVIDIQEKSSNWSVVSSRHKNILFDLLEPSTNYTLSFDVYSTFDIDNTKTISIIGSNGLLPYTNMVGTPYVKANTWTKISVVLTTVSTFPAKTDQHIYWSTINVIGTIKLCNLKLEKGTKATDWTPAPEDIDNKFANYSTTAQMQSAINIAKDSITQSVSDTYATKSELTTTNGTVTTLTSRLQSAESKLTKDSLVTTIGSYYATQEYATFSGGGDAKTYCWLCQIKIKASYVNTPAIIEINQRGHGYSLCEIRFVSTPDTDPGLLTIRKTGTPEWWIVKSSTSTWDVYVKKSEAWDEIHVIGFTRGTVSSVTWKCLNADLPNGSTVATQLAGLYAVDSTSGGTAGSNALITSGAAHSAISTAQTIATQTAEKFNWIVKSGTSATDFTLTDRTATLIAQTISLNGNVKVSGDMLVNGSITGDKVNTNSLFSQDITATGTIRGVTLEGAKGTFTGDVSAETLKIYNSISMVPQDLVTDIDALWSNSYEVMYFDNAGDLNISAGRSAKNIYVYNTMRVKNIVPMSSGYYLGGSLYGRQFSGVYAENFYEDGTSLSSKYASAYHSHSDYLPKSGGSTTGTVDFWGDVGFHTDTVVFAKPPAIYNLSTVTSGNYLTLSGSKIAYRSSSSQRYKDISREVNESDIRALYNTKVVWAKYKNGYLAEDDERYGSFMPMFIAEDIEDKFSLAVDHQDGLAENWNERIMIPVMMRMIQLQKDKLSEMDNIKGMLLAKVQQLEAQIQQLYAAG